MCFGPALHTKNVPRSTLLHANNTTKKCIQLLNKKLITTQCLYTNWWIKAIVFLDKNVDIKYSAHDTFLEITFIG